jgi:hypothetical protein
VFVAQVPLRVVLDGARQPTRRFEERLRLGQRELIELRAIFGEAAQELGRLTELLG